jgi:IclR family mhp operon transcriptional activator
MGTSNIANVKTIRSLERGLQVIAVLQDLGPATLKQIYEESGLPRPTLLRILRTLEASGLVRRGIGDGLYRNSFRLERMVAKLDAGDKVAEIAAPVIDRLCRKLKWPLDLAVLDTDNLCMVLKETSRPSSPFLLNRDQIGHQINIPLSAVGRIYLAHCGEQERESLIEQLITTRNPVNWLLEDRPAFDALLDKVRDQGYATRDPNFGGGLLPLRSQQDDGLDAIAVALPYDGNVLGSVTLLWLRKATSVPDIVADCLADLQTAKEEIIDAYRKLDTE